MSSVLPAAGVAAGTIDSTLARLRDEVADASTLANLAAASPDGLARLTMSGRFSDLNPAVERILGWFPEVLRGRTLPGLAHPDDREGCELRLARLVAACEARPGDHEEHILMRARRVDARWSWIEVHLRCERDDLGRPTSLVAAMRPVDERHTTHLLERRRTSEQAAMHRIGLAIAHGTTDGELCGRAAAELVEVVDAQAVMLFRADPASGQIECLASAWRDDFGDAHTDALDEPIDADGPAARTIAAGAPVRIAFADCVSDHGRGLALLWRTAVAVPVADMGDGLPGAIVSVHGHGEPAPPDGTERVLAAAAELLGAVMARS